MSETNTNTNASSNGQATEKGKWVGGSAGPFATQEEAQAGKPGNDKSRLFRVTRPDGKECWCWAIDSGRAVLVAAKAAGFKATEVGKPVDKDKLAEGLASMSEADRQALIAQYMPAPAPTGKGKK
jgi:hypothetical protein